MMEMRAVDLPALSLKVPRRPAPIAIESEGAGLPPAGGAAPPPNRAADEGFDLDGEDRPTLRQLVVQEGIELPEELLDPAAELPPPIPSPQRPTRAAQAFARRVAEADSPPTVAMEAFAEDAEDPAASRVDQEAPTKPIDDTVPVRAVRQRRPAPLEGTAPPALVAPKKPTRR
jgi:hypothetical protein